ncbi:MAG: hypothetical protein J6Y92_03070 [Lentisphaeria bacterium]|nr:hypothetical protein [Lentisphaeria bacterium]
MFHRFFLTVLLFASSVLVSACSSVTPARFQRGFTVGGVIHETVIDADGEASHFMVTGTPMERLFSKYLKENPSSVLFVGFFFHQDKTSSGSGTGTADVVNRAAFLALDQAPGRGMQTAEDLRTCLLKNDFDQATELLEKLSKEFDVETELERYPGSGNPKTLHEFKYNDKGEKVLHGLTRNYHENGMIANDCFFRDGRAEGELREYSELGVPLNADKAPAKQ